MLLDTVLPKYKYHTKPKSKGNNSHLTSLLKSVSWRIVGTLDTILIAYFITGKVQVAISIGSVELFTKFVLFYLHERAWVFAKRKIDSDET